MRRITITGILVAVFILSAIPSFSSEVILDEADIKGPLGETYQVLKKEVDGAPVLEFIAQDGTVYTREEFNALMMETTPVLSEELGKKIAGVEPTDLVNVTVYMR
ncbi:MAG: hypothetical protein IMF11_13665, partial [Proteobacteria bacterium]|nr:hypothetical protein [Pseudomonadota bacterium]